MRLPRLLHQTVRHFFPELNSWLDALPDARLQEAIVYPRRFLAWWGLGLFLFQLGSRRSLDTDLSPDSCALDNFNRLAGTEMKTRPVHDTLDYFLGKTQPEGFATLRRRMIRQLIRNKVLDAARVQGYVRAVLDGTGHHVFHERHCEHCLVQQHEHYTLYLHKVLEVKLLGPGGLALSCGNEFIHNADDPQIGTPEQRKQDCELKAFDRLAVQLKKDYPQTRLCLSGDSAFGCGRFFAGCKKHGWSFLAVFKPGRAPALYQEFQALLAASPENRLERRLAGGVRRVYRWVEGLPYEDSEGRKWMLNALECKETVGGVTTTFAFVTDLRVNVATVEEVTQSGRDQWKIENEGFNRQKNSGMNLEHVYTHDPDKLKAYYYLLQIAHIILQLVERGSLLRRLAAEYGQTVQGLFGSLKGLAKRLLEGIRGAAVVAEDSAAEAVGQIRLDYWNSS